MRNSIALDFVIISANNIADPLELKKLAVLPMLRALVLYGKNPP